MGSGANRGAPIPPRRPATPPPADTRRAAAPDARARSGAATAAAGRGGRSSGRRRLIDYPRQGRSGVRRWLPSWRLVLGTFLTILALLVGLLVAAYAATDIPSPDEFVDAQTTTVYYSDGTTEMGTFGAQNRVLVDGATIPEHVRAAVVAAEDRSFYENRGISPTGIARALWNNVRGGSQQGGSTITQQYAERYYIGSTVSDYRGKAREALLAIKLDQVKEKDEILADYLNTIYFGRDSYGIETAAQSYFGVGAADLTVSQAALIAGIIPSPNNWDPRVDPERAEQRWNYVLDGMVITGALTQAERDEQVYPETIEYTRSDTYAGPQGYLLDMVRREVIEESTVSEEELDLTGYRIVTTIDKGLQDAAVAAAQSLPEDAPESLRRALVSLDPATGAIVALYGGADYLEVQRNAVTQDQAQPGSTFKPFTLVANLENGNSLRSRYPGANRLPVEGFEDGVRNFSDQSFGELDVVDATARSVNSVYAQMNVEVGPAVTLDVANRAGVPEEDLEEYDTPANVLGTPFVSPIDMAQAFNTFAAQGVRTEPFLVQTMEYLDGGLAYEGGSDPERQFEADVMADTTYALTQVVESPNGTARQAQEIGHPVAGKTGTSNDNRSAWFIGYTGHLTTAVALYQVDEEGNPAPITGFGGVDFVTGGSFPLDIWTAFMTPAMAGREVIQFPPRADVGEPNTPPIVQVPSVVGLSEADARQAIEAVGLGVAVSSENHPSMAEGLVIGASASQAELGSTVTIVVSLGPGTVTVPGVTGLSEGEARGALEGAGLAVAVERERSESVPAGQVISSNPSGGEVAPGSTVTIVVSDGPPQPEPEPEEPEPTQQPEEPAEEPEGDEDAQAGAGGGSGAGSGRNGVGGLVIDVPPNG